MNEEEHKAYHRRLLYIMAVLLVILFGGATFYHLQEGWSYLDSVYFSASTMTTVGNGIYPVTVWGKIFTIFYVFAGVGIALYGLSLLSAHFVEIREEFWLQQIGKMRIRQHTETFWGKIKHALNFSSSGLTAEYRVPNKRKK